MARRPIEEIIIKPAFARMFDKIKRKGKRVCLHSCGDLREIFGELVDLGLDIYNTVQPEIYNLAEMKRLYGRRIVFYGGISTQQFLPYASAEETRAKTREVRRTLAREGGCILAPTHAVTPDIPVVNVLAMVAAAQEVEY
ncbi:MAG: hypothetical protein HY360_27355 [Verrucomicrobia bacterium]|nr:hypothetical protein [Verrucomicrobiota bacterium]